MKKPARGGLSWHRFPKGDSGPARQGKNPSAAVQHLLRWDSARGGARTHIPCQVAVSKTAAFAVSPRALFVEVMGFEPPASQVGSRAAIPITPIEHSKGLPLGRPFVLLDLPLV